MNFKIGLELLGHPLYLKGTIRKTRKSPMVINEVIIVYFLNEIEYIIKNFYSNY